MSVAEAAEEEEGNNWAKDELALAWEGRDGSAGRYACVLINLLTKPRAISQSGRDRYNLRPCLDQTAARRQWPGWAATNYEFVGIPANINIVVDWFG